MELAIINSLLPAEILGRVFDLLSHTDLKSAVLVCRWWREVGESPLLWTWACLKVEVLQTFEGPDSAVRLGIVRDKVRIKLDKL